MKLDKWLMCQLQPEFLIVEESLKPANKINISGIQCFATVLQMFPLGSWRGGLLRVHSSQTAGTRTIFRIRAWAQRRRTQSTVVRSPFERSGLDGQVRGTPLPKGTSGQERRDVPGFFLCYFHLYWELKVGGTLHTETEICWRYSQK